MYRGIVNYIVLNNTSNAVTINAKSTGSTQICVTDPNMRFEIWHIIAVAVNVAGATFGPVISIGVTSAAYSDQLSTLSLGSITTNNGSTVTNAGGATAKSIASSTGIFVNVTSAATATTYNLNIFLCGIYY